MRLQIKALLSLFFVTPVVAFPQTKVTTKDFRILSATVANWSSGTARENTDGARGVQYEIVAVVKSNKGIMIDSLITEKGSIAVEVIAGFRRSLGRAEVKKSDTVQIVARLVQGKSLPTLSKETRTAISKLKKPQQVSFLLYRNNGKRWLAPLGEFTKKSVSEPNQ